MSSFGADFRATVRREFQAVLSGYERVQPRFPALLGNGFGVVETAEDKIVYARLTDSSVPVKVLNQVAPNIDNLPVIIGYDPLQPSLFQVLSIRELYVGTGGLVVPRVVEHHETHEFGNTSGGYDTVWVQKQQVMPFQPAPENPASMRIKVAEEIYPFGSGVNHWPGGYTDVMTARVPAVGGQARYVGVSVDGATNTLQYVNGNTFPVLLPPVNKYAWIPAYPLGSVPVCAIYLPNGVTELSWGNIVDTRMLVSPIGGSMAPGVHTHESGTEGGTLDGAALTADAVLMIQVFS